MSKPVLQIALDQTSLTDALNVTRRIAPHVDVLEAGTILCAAEGAPAVVSALRALYPGQTIVADLKVADAGSVIAEMVFSRGADWMTVICAAPLATMKSAKKVADAYGGDIQIELYGDWTFEQAADWLDAGITQAIYHRGRDAQAAGQTWGEEDLGKIRRLSEMGFAVSATGGLSPEDVHLFRGIPVKCFIAGRSLSEAEDPAAEAAAFRAAIDRYWS
jgi:3-dehydro-L-gulonate-6-phosphate decarboxylase